MNQRPLDFQSNALPLSYLSQNLCKFKLKSIINGDRTHDLLIKFYHWFQIFVSLKIYWVINGTWTHDLLIHNQTFYHWTIITFRNMKKEYDGKGTRTPNPWIMIPIFYHWTIPSFRGKRESNPQPLVWQTNALPIKLFPLHKLFEKLKFFGKDRIWTYEE